jgi:hypothetical protein
MKAKIALEEKALMLGSLLHLEKDSVSQGINSQLSAVGR